MKPENKNTLTTIVEKGEIVLYQPDESIRLEVRIEDETVWLSQAQMAELFGTNRQAITKHIKNIYETGELDREATSSILELLQKEGNRNVKRKIEFYNLDTIISVGFRVNTRQGILFRTWANNVLKKYLLKGYAVHPSLQQVEYHLSKQIESQREEMFLLQQKVQNHEQKIDFLIQKEQPATEQLFSTGCVWDAYTFVSNLIRSAAKRIVLIDSFVDERTLLILDKRADGVDCTIHTRYNSKLQLDIQKHNQQCNHIDIIQLPQAVHDRYLIIDDEVWLLGASVKDMGRGLCTIIKLGFSPEEILKRI
ncbi:MAG: virulence RhuM family protein [Bacteroidales bacterium]|nr:virulence RhuM family protein [Bacteroidales bacterium]